MSHPGITHRLLLAGSLASSLAFAAQPLENAYLGGLFQRAENDPKEHPLPPVQKLELLENQHTFRIGDLRTGKPFAMPAVSTYPVGATPQYCDLAKDFPDDGRTFAAPVDLTGCGLSDLVYARQGWDGWKVLSNGARLPKPYQGFVAGLFEPGKEAATVQAIPASTSDLQVDHDLLAAVGDFLGTGSEQLAYTRPGWTQIWVVGANGVVQMAADLGGIEANGPGARVHWLFPFDSTGAKHTRLAYYRMGRKELVTFAPKGMAFKRGQEPLSRKGWARLCQNVLDWPKDPPGMMEKVEQKAGEVKEAFGQLVSASGQ